MEYSKIIDQLYVGIQPDQELKAELESLGITASVNLRQEYDDKAHGLDFPNYCYLPTIDETPPTLTDLAEGVAFITKVIENGGQVYIHCAAGVGRAPTMAVAYLISQGYTLGTALALVREKRPIVQLTKGQYTILNTFATSIN
ncbi:MAG: dual specificity protein phosphatase [Chloroflexota bacterium]